MRSSIDMLRQVVPVLAKIRVPDFWRIILIGALLTSCNYRVLKDPEYGSKFNGTFSREEISFPQVEERVFQQSCIGCHGSGSQFDLAQYSSVVSHLSQIKDAVFVSRTMPKSGSLSAEQYALLQTWLAAGAPANPVDGPTNPAPTPVPSPVEPTFASIQQHIFVVRCVLCHTPTGEAKNVLLDTSAELLNSPRDLVLPGNPDESGLMIAIQRQDDKRMPPSRTGTALSDIEISAIRLWIQNGAKD